MSADKLLYSGPKWQVDLFIDILEQNGVQYYFLLKYFCAMLFLKKESKP